MAAEVKIKGKKYGEDTEITLSVKTVAWIVGILFSVITTLATLGYFDMKHEIKNQKKIFEDEKVQYTEAIKVLLQSELKEETEKRELMYKDIYDIKGDIKVILDRTGGNHGNTSTVVNPNSMPLPAH